MEGTHNTGHFWQGPHVLGQGCRGSGTRASRPGTGTKRSPCVAGGECSCAGLGGGQEPPSSQGVGEVSEPLSPHFTISLCISLHVSPSVSLSQSLSISCPCLPLQLSLALWPWLTVSTLFFVSFYSLPYPPFPHFSVVSSAAVRASDFLSLFLYVSLCFRVLMVSVCSVPGCCLFLQFLCVSVLQIFFLINLSSFWLFLRCSHTCMLLHKLFTLWRMPFLFSLQPSKLLFILKNTPQKPQTTCWSFP